MNGREENHFDRIWKHKLKDVHSATYVAGDNPRVDETLSLIPQGGRVLDIGCGTGAMLTQLKSRFDEVYGIDISSEAVRVALQNGVQASVVDLNITSLPYEDDFFDVVTILSTLQYFIDLDKTLRECHRVLVPGGMLILSVPNMRALWRVGRLLFQGTFPRVSLDTEGYDGGTLHYFAFANLRELLSKEGFEVLSAHGIFCLPRFLNRTGNAGLWGWAKREFFSAEIFIRAVKV